MLSLNLTGGEIIWYDQVVMLRAEEPARSTSGNCRRRAERVLDTALAEFTDQGYQAASLNRLVAQAGIAEGSLYQYFPDKEGIFRHIFQFALNQVRRTLTTVKDETQEEGLFVRLEKSLLAGVRFLREHPRIFSLYLKIQVDKNMPFRAEFLATVRRHAAEYFASLVRRAKAGESSRPGVPRGCGPVSAGRPVRPLSPGRGRAGPGCDPESQSGARGRGSPTNP